MAALFGGAGGAAGTGGDAATAGDQFNVGFEKMAEAAQRACQGDIGPVDANYVDHITQALKVRWLFWAAGVFCPEANE